MATEAQIRAVKKYKAAHQSTISLTVQKEVKENLKAEAEKRGLSLAGFILRCVDRVIDSGIEL